MLSKRKIISLIDEYSKTAAGKAKIAEQHKGKFNAWIAKGGDKQRTVKQMKEVGEDMKRILYDQIAGVIPSFKQDDIIVSKPRLVGGQYEISIQFNSDALHRDSLDPDRYPSGIVNIVWLFMTGYDARGAVRGVWHGHGDNEIWSLRHREPNQFMQNAIDTFNEKYASIAHAELDEEYKRILRGGGTYGS